MLLGGGGGGHAWSNIFGRVYVAQGWIQHDLVGGALPTLVPSCVDHVRRPPINLLD
jgi:hypothetical protein